MLIIRRRTNLSRQPQWREQFSAVTSPCCFAEFDQLNTTYPAEYVVTPSSSVDTEVDYPGKAEECTSIPSALIASSLRVQDEMLLQRPRNQTMATLSDTKLLAGSWLGSNNHGHLSSTNKAPSEYPSWLPQESVYPTERCNFSDGFPGLELSSTVRAPVINCCSQTTVDESPAFEAMDMDHLNPFSTMTEGSSGANERLLDRRPQTILTTYGLHDETILELTKILVQSKKEWHIRRTL